MPNRKRPRHARCNPAVAGVGMSLAVACSAGADFSSGEALGAPDGMGDAVPESYGESELQGVAYVDVEHTRTPDVELSQAIAHVARGGNLDRLAMTARLVGLSLEVPAPGRCISPATQSNPPLVSVSELSLLEAGAITIYANPSRFPAWASGEQDNDDGDSTVRGVSEPGLLPPVVVSLAPRAFPSVSGLASGVVYTSRDRVTRLPDNTLYRVEIAGGGEFGPMTLTGQAPAHLENVTVSGLPLVQIQTLNRGAPIDVTWDVGASGDIVFVEVVDAVDGSVAIRCSFSDAAGSGSVPWLDETAAVPMPYEARLNVHRYRRVARESPAAGGPSGELRFDFELSQDVRFD